MGCILVTPDICQCAAAMRPYVKLLLLLIWIHMHQILVCISVITDWPLFLKFHFNCYNSVICCG